MSEAVDSDLNKHYEKQAKNERELEFFNDDIESHLNIIEEQLLRIRTIASSYDIELEDVIREQVIDILTNGKGTEDVN